MDPGFVDKAANNSLMFDPSASAGQGLAASTAAKHSSALRDNR
jgi:hypothetical protein